MSLSDPLGDMLTRIRNALARKKSTVKTPSSSLRLNVLKVLKEEGYIRNFKVIELANNKSEIEIELKYHEGSSVIKDIARISKPGRRVYSSVKSIPDISNGLGISILSTPAGVIADHQAREKNVGGELLCRVF